MPERIAIASTDGKVINQHFGRAEIFYIIDVFEDRYEFIEDRYAQASCQGFQHDKGSFDAVLELLSDCKAVFVSRIGLGAAEYLIRNGVRVFESPGVIEDVLNQVIRDRSLVQKSTAE